MIREGEGNKEESQQRFSENTLQIWDKIETDPFAHWYLQEPQLKGKPHDLR